MKFEFELPVKAQNSQNARLHPMARHRLTRRERELVATFMPRHQLRPLLRITLVRVGPKELDDDNLAASCKSIRDGIASALGIDDGSKLVEWKYDQAPGVHAVRVVVEALGELPPDTRPPPKPWQLPAVLVPASAVPVSRPRSRPKNANRAAPKDLRALATSAVIRPGGRR